MMESNPGTVQWGNAMPVNIMEEMNADQIALGMGIVDKETIAKRYQSRYGVDWETIVTNLANEAAVSAAADNNIGAQILRNFNSGQ
jgi:hypothetical protein